jgi:hypothetical protein
MLLHFNEYYSIVIVFSCHWHIVMCELLWMLCKYYHNVLLYVIFILHVALLCDALNIQSLTPQVLS